MAKKKAAKKKAAKKKATKKTAKKKAKKKATKKKTKKRRAAGKKLPDGVDLVQMLRGGRGKLYGVVWSPGGEMLAAGGEDGTVRIWDGRDGELVRELRGDEKSVYAVAWSPDGERLAAGGESDAIYLWDRRSGEVIHKLQGYEGFVYGVIWSVDGETVASCTMDRTLRLWDAESGRLVSELKGHEGPVYDLAMSPDGRRLATGGMQGSVWIWGMEDGKMVGRLEGHTSLVASVDWSGDGELIVSGGGDGLVKIWNAREGREITTLEGHTDIVVGVEFCGDGRLVATLGHDNTVRLWRRDTWGGIGVLRLVEAKFHGLCFHPREPLLAAVDSEGEERVIRIWRVDYERLVEGRPAVEALTYQNAKAVLLGDTGVGKTGLALALTGKGFEATESTHGRHVWTFEKSRDKKAKVEREIMLWDMAGQPGYRLVHQLHLQEVSAAMVLVDSRSETDPMRGVEFWARVLKQERSAIPLKKFLVEARIDVGRAAISRGELAAFASDPSASRHSITSLSPFWTAWNKSLFLSICRFYLEV